MRRVIAGGTGLIGKFLIAHWLKQNHDITVIGRSQKHIQSVFGDKVQAITWNELTSKDLQSAEVVLNLTGAGIGDKRWTKSRKQEILNSRIDSTKTIAQLLAELGANSPRLFNTSAVGVYGLQTQLDDRLPTRLDEDLKINWNHPTDFLSLVARQWGKNDRTCQRTRCTRNIFTFWSRVSQRRRCFTQISIAI